MNNFRMYVPTDIRFGKNRLEELPEVLAEYGKKVLLAYGGGSIKKSGLYDKVVQLLNEQNFTIVELTGIEPNPKIESVREGVRLVREHDLDVILAVGGGSVVDAAKVIAGAVFYEGDAWDVVVDKSKMSKALPLVDILTLSATGTEMNRNAVISNTKTNEKFGTSGWELIPKASFLDPENTYTVSSYQTSAGSADIMSHLCEQYFNRTQGVDVQTNVAEALMKTVIQNTPLALENPNDYDARSNLMWASTLALNGLVGNGAGQGWTCHPIEHELSAFYDITHGIGLAIVTPRWLKFCIEKDDSTHERIANWARNVWNIIEENDEKAARLGVRAMYHYFKDNTKIEMTLQATGITTTEKVREMSELAVKHGGLNSQNPYVPMTENDVEKVLLDCFEEMTVF
ncbi:hypothetical protein SAMN02745116_00700 [Pilibacter termitis]|uniref:Uncharacterized protein n=1 Tax=Pilibacter termitis TaxID=263852 RepID=A0A1T4LKL1_9ENTE|nr:iron-containing alcohol dehydrogenase [Pilibacter termitis]SJZ55259.1 hypothetical protein SAMN02745116_00700 [Pilibacter termitis]